jgi:hypothetical protein
MEQSLVPCRFCKAQVARSARRCPGCNGHTPNERAFEGRRTAIGLIFAALLAVLAGGAYDTGDFMYSAIFWLSVIAITAGCIFTARKALRAP